MGRDVKQPVDEAYTSENEEVHDRTVFHFSTAELFAGVEERSDTGRGAGRRSGCAGNEARVEPARMPALHRSVGT